MKVKVIQEKLAKALGNVSRIAAGSRATLPILNNVLIRFDDNRLTLTTTNLDMAVVNYLPVSDGERGVAAVPARLLAEFVANLPRGEQVEMSTEGEKMTIQANGYTSSINGAPADDFPELPEIDESKAVKIEIPAEAFKLGLTQVMIAVSNDMARPALTGVYFNTYEGSLYLAATDGYRLAEKKIADDVTAEVMAIVPAGSLRSVLSLLSENVDKVEVLFDETQVRFRLGEVELTSKLVDGSFPDYRQLIPKESEIIVELDKGELARITKLAALFAKEVGGSIVCSSDSDKQVFQIAAVANELGENNSEIPTSVSIDARVTVNSRFLLDVLNVMTAEKVTVGFSNKLDPMVIRGAGVNDYTHIVMPLRG